MYILSMRNINNFIELRQAFQGKLNKGISMGYSPLIIPEQLQLGIKNLLKSMEITEDVFSLLSEAVIKKEVVPSFHFVRSICFYFLATKVCDLFWDKKIFFHF